MSTKRWGSFGADHHTIERLKNIVRMFPHTSPLPHILIHRLSFCVDAFIPYPTCPLVTEPHLTPASRKGHHISKVNPNIEDNPYKGSYHWSNHLVSPYYVPGRDSSQMSLESSSTSKVGTVLRHLPFIVSGILSQAPPPFFVYSQQMPCQYRSLKMDPMSTTLQGVVLGWPSWVAQDEGFPGMQDVWC